MPQPETTTCRPPADAKSWRWRYVLELPGEMATIRTVATWLPDRQEWKRLGTPEQASAIGWRYVRPALPDEVDDLYG